MNRRSFLTRAALAVAGLVVAPLKALTSERGAHFLITDNHVTWTHFVAAGPTLPVEILNEWIRKAQPGDVIDLCGQTFAGTMVLPWKPGPPNLPITIKNGRFVNRLTNSSGAADPWIKMINRS